MIKPPSKAGARLIEKGGRTSTYANEVEVPVWGSSGKFGQYVHVLNNQDRAVLYAAQKTGGALSPLTGADISVDLSKAELGQFIAELAAIHASLPDET